MYRPTKSGMGNSVVRLVFVSFDYFSNFQFPEKSSGRGDMTLCQQRDKNLSYYGTVPVPGTVPYSMHTVCTVPLLYFEFRAILSRLFLSSFFAKAKVVTQDDMDRVKMVY